MRCVLSYFRSYFDPDSEAALQNHSAGQIAKHLYDTLGEYGEVRYFGGKERPSGLSADLFIGHFWSFREICELNSFDLKIAFYSVSDPDKTRQMLETVARRFDVPVPYWDLPPAGFDHERTMELADLVFVVGNTYTLDTFPTRWRHKIRLLNYSVDMDVFDQAASPARRKEFCYVATHCGLRKGFMDILQTWRSIDASTSRLHAIGELGSPWSELLERNNTGSIVHHGWIESHTEEYRRIIESCHFAHIPTYSEGQMGTLLEVIFSGCIPITTRASGIDDNLLEHCLVVEPLDIGRQKEAILHALSWSEAECERRRKALVATARRYHNWSGFKTGVRAAVKDLVAQPIA